MAAAEAAEVAAMVMVLFASIFVVVVVCGGSGGLWWAGSGEGCGLARSSGIYIIHYLSKLTVPKI
jgi:hypothetical protein